MEKNVIEIDLEKLEDRVRGTEGFIFWSMFVAHPATLGVGIYKGINDAIGNPSPDYAFPIMGMNIITTGLHFGINDFHRNLKRGTVEGLAVGGVLSAVEFMLGYGIGYGGTLILK